VSKAAKSSSGGDPLPFEDALKKLETIVEAMEADDLPLEQLLQRFEEGASLAKLCQSRLSDAEVKVRQLEESLGGTLVARPVSVESGDAEG
jgi:exodeoxyribonuclease VII small subunit